MNRLNRMAAAARHGAVRLLPAGRRDWVAAVWAEAHEVPPGLAWRAGGVWMLAREAPGTETVTTFCVVNVDVRSLPM